MTGYRDFDNNWNFNTNGDLTLTDDYTQSINNRFKCTKEHLQAYYDLRYGSDLHKLIGEHYNQAEAKLIIEQTLSNDKNIQTYTIDKITYNTKTLKVLLTINGVNMFISIGDEA